MKRYNQITRIITLLLMTGLLLGLATPALAQGGGGSIGGALDTIVTAITDIIQTVCVGLGILGLSIWGIGKIARPVFPQISGLTANYMGDLMIGIAVVFVASQIVEGLASAMGGA
ncbi:MAG: hypothetical protein DPW09_26430 [Anaerolineae bacterium]|nr:hypothetical protein [Anaerolineae bacterium]